MDRNLDIDFGVSLTIDGRSYRLTGTSPSRSIKTEEDLVNVILDFFNGHLGTSFTVADIGGCDERED